MARLRKVKKLKRFAKGLSTQISALTLTLQQLERRHNARFTALEQQQPQQPQQQPAADNTVLETISKHEKEIAAAQEAAKANADAISKHEKQLSAAQETAKANADTISRHEKEITAEQKTAKANSEAISKHEKEIASGQKAAKANADAISKHEKEIGALGARAEKISKDAKDWTDELSKRVNALEQAPKPNPST